MIDEKDMLPMDQAPTDGTHVLLYGAFHDECLGWLNGWGEGYYDHKHGWYGISGCPAKPVGFIKIFNPIKESKEKYNFIGG